MRDYRKTYYYDELSKLDKEEIIKRLITISDAHRNKFLKLKENESEGTEKSWNEWVIVDSLIDALFDDECYQNALEEGFVIA